MKLLRLFTILSLGITPFLTSKAYANEENSYQVYQEVAISSAAGMPWNAARHLELVQRATNLLAQSNEYLQRKTYPISGYFNFLQKGLNLMGDDFKAMWWATTYLADQKTLVNELPYRVIDLKSQ